MKKESVIQNIEWLLDDYKKSNCSANDVIVGIRRNLSDYDDSQKSSVLPRIIPESDPKPIYDRLRSEIAKDGYIVYQDEDKRTAYSESDMKKSWNKALEALVKRERIDFDTWISEYER